MTVGIQHRGGVVSFAGPRRTSGVVDAGQLALVVGCRDMRRDLMHPLHLVMRYRMVYLRRR